MLLAINVISNVLMALSLLSWHYVWLTCSPHAFLLAHKSLASLVTILTAEVPNPYVSFSCPIPRSLKKCQDLMKNLCCPIKCNKNTFRFINYRYSYIYILYTNLLYLFIVLFPIPWYHSNKDVKHSDTLFAAICKIQVKKKRDWRLDYSRGYVFLVTIHL